MVYVILVLAIIFLFFFCLYLTFKNQNMANKIKNLEFRIEIDENNNIKNNYDKLDIMNKEEMSKEIDKAIIESTKKNDNYEKEKVEYNTNEIKFPDRAYKENLLDTISHIVSPINIDNKEEYVVMNNQVSNNVNLNDFIKKNTSFKDLVKKEKIEKKEDNISFLKDLSKKLESSLGPQTIELTDYEKEQEENAIISYKEFLKVKDELYEINEAKENEEFLKDLKAFRNNLN